MYHRDPPSSLGSTELRDISFTPTAIRPAKITIIHPQLRDLILPLSRGRVLYPRGLNIDEIRWFPNDEDGDSASKSNVMLREATIVGIKSLIDSIIL